MRGGGVWEWEERVGRRRTGVRCLSEEGRGETEKRCSEFQNVIARLKSQIIGQYETVSEIFGQKNFNFQHSIG